MKPRRVLFVDDDERLVHSYRRLFHPLRDRFQLRFETDPRQAEALAAEEIWDILICDRMMPGLTGDRILEKAKSLHGETTAILLTGEESGRDWTELPHIDHCIHKPFPFEDLLRLLEEP